MSFSIRQLNRDDAAIYRALRLESLQKHPEAFGATYESAVQRPDDSWAQTLEKLTIFGGFAEGGQLVGLAGFMASDGDKDRHRGWLIQMYVQEPMRGTGCAKALVEAVVEHAKTRVLQLHLGVYDKNEAAIRFYQRAGFDIYASDPRAYYWGGRFYGDHLMVRYFDEAPGKSQND